jgi:hypothetical protein
MREAQIQRTIVDYLHAVLPRDCRVAAIPNAARRTRTGRAANAVAGLSPGLFDLMIVEAGGGVYFIEIKTARGRLSPAQEGWREWFVLNHVPHCVARGVDDVRVALAHWRIETREAA